MTRQVDPVRIAEVPPAVASVRHTISWEVLQQLGARLARVYTSGSVPIAVRRESTTTITAAPGGTIPSY